MSHLKVAGFGLQQAQLILSPVFGFLIANVLANDFFVPTYGRHEEASRPEVFADEIALSLAERPGDVDSALALDEPHDLRHRIFWRDLHYQMHMIGLYIQFRHFDLVLLLAQLIHQLFDTLADRFFQYPVAIFRTEYQFLEENVHKGHLLPPDFVHETCSRI